MARTRDKEKPAQIIEAAFAVFGDVGYEATVIKDIAEKAGISSGTIYTYFSDKRDLFRATALEGWNRFLQQIREIAVSAAPPMRASGASSRSGSQISRTRCRSCAACSSNLPR